MKQTAREPQRARRGLRLEEGWSGARLRGLRLGSGSAWSRRLSEAMSEMMSERSRKPWRRQWRTAAGGMSRSRMAACAYGVRCIGRGERLFYKKVEVKFASAWVCGIWELLRRAK